MSIIVFLGPTLSVAEARERLQATYLPPAGFGDVYRAALTRPTAIGLIDGYFEHRPAVWHKEVLWALSQGVQVFGAASMGALRAAELARFGMQGVGSIFQAFHSGELTDDDEVAVAHADGAAGYRVSSEAMVNIRATLHSAERARVISSTLRAELEALAKATFYPERNYAMLLAHAERERGCSGELRAFISARRVDQKRADALELLGVLARKADSPAGPTASFELSITEPWTELLAWAQGQPSLCALDLDAPHALIAAEVRALGPRGAAMLAKALTRAVAEALRSDRCARAELLQAFERNLDAEARHSELWSELVRRALDKQQRLTASRVTPSDLRGAHASADEIVQWYFARIGSELPVADTLDERHLLELGISSREDLEHEALREYLYVNVLGA